MLMTTDILIVGSGCAGLYCALKLPKDKNITIITKREVEKSDSFLAQGGMCVMKSEDDYESYYEDTMKAGHYENDPDAVKQMILESPKVLEDLISYGADFHKNDDGSLDYTREGGHREKRIVFHEDQTGREITTKLYEKVRQLSNVTICEFTKMVDLIVEDNICYGAVVRKPDKTFDTITADVTVLASGGIGGLYKQSTNWRNLTGDALAISMKYGIKLKHINYIQVHPTTFYTEDTYDRTFLISESVRGEGALIYDKNMNRFTDELAPRDVLTAEIRKQMKIDGTKHVWEDMRTIDADELNSHFPYIVNHCKEAGYNPEEECIPVAPAQHYFMGGIDVDLKGHTSCDCLYAIGETACNGVHGRNRLASNSLLESLVWGEQAAFDISNNPDKVADRAKGAELAAALNMDDYLKDVDLSKRYREMVLNEIDRVNEAEGLEGIGIDIREM